MLFYFFLLMQNIDRYWVTLLMHILFSFCWYFDLLYRRFSWHNFRCLHFLTINYNWWWNHRKLHFLNFFLMLYSGWFNLNQICQVASRVILFPVTHWSIKEIVWAFFCDLTGFWWLVKIIHWLGTSLRNSYMTRILNGISILLAVFHQIRRWP
jgi:hypothetical protein